MEQINHFYHIYCDNHWLEAVEEHVKALKEHDLINNISKIYIGLVGTEENRSILKDYLNNNSINYIVVDEQEDAWEQMTMNKLYEFSLLNDGLIFYAHTKGAYNFTPINISWRSSMCYFNVVKWKDAVSHFEKGVDTVGCHWCHNAFWGGTYWWAKAEYIRTLGYPLTDNRWRAEEWIGAKQPKIFDMNPGWPDPKRFITSW